MHKLWNVSENHIKNNVQEYDSAKRKQSITVTKTFHYWSINNEASDTCTGGKPTFPIWSSPVNPNIPTA